jgi:hypothetical protein
MVNGNHWYNWKKVESIGSKTQSHFRFSLTYLPVHFENTMQNNTSDMGLIQAKYVKIQARLNATTTFPKPL